MSRINVDYGRLPEVATDYTSIARNISDLKEQIRLGIRSLDWKIKNKSDIEAQAGTLLKELENYENSLREYSSFILEAAEAYEKVDTPQINSNDPVLNIGTATVLNVKPTPPINFLNYKDIFSFLGQPGKLFSLISNLEEVDSSLDWLKNINSGIAWLSSNIDKAQRYIKIGRATGKTTAFTNWFKNIMGWKPVGRASTSTDIGFRFRANFYNGNGPFKTSLSNSFKAFVGKSGTLATVTSWAGLIFSGISNYNQNVQEQKENGMSDIRFWYETIGQTAVDVGGTALIMAGTSAVMATFGAPAVVTMLVGTGLTMGINKGIEAISGGKYNLSEVVVDGIPWLGEKIWDSGKTIADWIGKGAVSVKNSCFALLGY